MSEKEQKPTIKLIPPKQNTPQDIAERIRVKVSELNALCQEAEKHLMVIEFSIQPGIGFVTKIIKHTEL